MIDTINQQKNMIKDLEKTIEQLKSDKTIIFNSNINELINEAESKANILNSKVIKKEEEIRLLENKIIIITNKNTELISNNK